MTDILNQLLTITGILGGAYLLSYCVARGWKHGMGKPTVKYYDRVGYLPKEVFNKKFKLKGQGVANE